MQVAVIGFEEEANPAGVIGVGVPEFSVFGPKLWIRDRIRPASDDDGEAQRENNQLQAPARSTLHVAVDPKNSVHGSLSASSLALQNGTMGTHGQGFCAEKSTSYQEIAAAMPAHNSSPFLQLRQIICLMRPTRLTRTVGLW